MDITKLRTLTISLSLRRHVGMILDATRGFFWPLFGYQNPVPIRAKRKVLLRYGADHSVWVETGTYLGRTTEWLAGFSTSVISIEPQQFLARYVARRLRHKTNVKVIEGLSEVVLATVLPQLNGNVSFWLDGHFSEGITGSGFSTTPIRHELALIEQHKNQFGSMTVFIDDFSSFGPHKIDHRGYPPRTEIVNWAMRNDLLWTVEHDVFVATSAKASTT